ncbi:hypothetical protein BLNAU_8722 [Blattamonas nauphoetae]|uniref:Uncharacterized protein n=1 Tax=Blattamonas nauphoetae TaxID=2049346 RepID=A0ABQ9XXY4_9EUKA|nr:hypothetical protein BLNAU_8722 [Blattamonas nauphoetae]
MESISVVGTDLSLESKHLIGGTGPLFSFGLTEQTSSLSASDCVLQMEASLHEGRLMNLTSSSSAFSPGKQLFGGEVSQRVVGSCVVSSTNHDRATGMMSPNLGGNVMCLNTSFSSCIRERNKDLEYSFQNRTQTSDPGRLDNVTSDVTSVSFTLCTFNTMTVSTGGTSGGAAIFLYQTSSSLTVRTCFFHKCTCTGKDDTGGAIIFVSRDTYRRPLSISGSSFTNCSSLSGTGSSNLAGSLFAQFPSLLSVDSCFFDVSKAAVIGAVAVRSFTVTMSNTAFVECSSDMWSGALAIEDATTLKLSFLQFRQCICVNDPNAKDISFLNFASNQITASMIESCDSNSGHPNVHFTTDSKPDSTLVPQISTSSTTTIKYVDVSVDENEATVRVATAESIKGTMNVLLDGSNVPRLVNVVFGDDTTSSNLGTAVVSSGANGILPRSDYAFRTAAVNGYRIIIPIGPFIFEASSTLKDWNITQISLSGVNLKKGSYWMLVENGGIEVNVTLTRSNSTILTGTAILHQSTSDGKLEWETEYEVKTVMWCHSQQHRQQAHPIWL